jgi:8-oxo-dGTP diphosphatase
VTQTGRRPHSTEKSNFRFCPLCGAVLLRNAVNEGEHEGGAPARPRCSVCEFVHWLNPVVGVAAIIWERPVVSLLGEDHVRSAQHDPEWRPDPDRSRVLLVRRAASRSGLWCLPCGYVEFDEEIREALCREVLEETGLAVTPGSVAAVHSNFHDPDRQSVGVWFNAMPWGGSLRAGDDADALGFFPPQMPGVPLAFPTDTLVLGDLTRA